MEGLEVKTKGKLFKVFQLLQLCRSWNKEDQL